MSLTIEAEVQRTSKVSNFVDGFLPLFRCSPSPIYLLATRPGPSCIDFRFQAVDLVKLFR